VSELESVVLAFVSPSVLLVFVVDALTFANSAPFFANLSARLFQLK
jgi:hypothetical protein